MKVIEIEGKTIDEAIQNACRQFDAPREKLNIEIISEGSSGFLGFGAKKAKIKASLMQFDMSFDEPLDKPVKAPAKASRERNAGKTEPKAAPAPPPDVPAADSPFPDKAPEGENGQIAFQAKQLLEGILTRMDLSYPVTVEETEEAVNLKIRGDGGGLLIGRRGQNLDAIQYIITKAMNKAGSERKIISVDIEEYRQKRESSLIALAEKLGEKVKKSRKPVTVDHMNARDRRIIHMALQNDESLVTKSRGEGEYKKIVIMPVKKK
ncbi:MAG: Jag N-terminal domain-containing protein [Deltaproteobacteria bacterium]|nr:Jag N-terminal domain-containing protein [Deltaproteobacteria bacterium]